MDGLLPGLSSDIAKQGLGWALAVVFFTLLALRQKRVDAIQDARLADARSTEAVIQATNVALTANTKAQEERNRLSEQTGRTLERVALLLEGQSRDMVVVREEIVKLRESNERRSEQHSRDMSHIQDAIRGRQ